MIFTPPATPIVVTFECRYVDALGWDDPNNVSPYISVAYPDDSIAGQRYPDEIVIRDTVINIEYTYPLDASVVYLYTSDSPQGFTRANLARVVCEGYQRIYDEEFPPTDDPSTDDASPVGDSSDEFMAAYGARIARCTGIHGIWGHGIGDLMLCAVTQTDVNLYSLSVDS